MQAAISATPARHPITMPAMAPPDTVLTSTVWTVAAGVSVAEVVVVEVLVASAGDVVGPVVVGWDDVGWDEAEVCVTAIRARGSKVQELADGLAELRDEKVSFKALTLMLVSVSWAEFQQMLIWFGAPVQISLPAHTPSARRLQKRKEKEGERGSRRFIETAPRRVAAAAVERAAVLGACRRDGPADIRLVATVALARVGVARAGVGRFALETPEGWADEARQVRREEVVIEVVGHLGRSNCVTRATCRHTSVSERRSG